MAQGIRYFRHSRLGFGRGHLGRPGVNGTPRIETQRSDGAIDYGEIEDYGTGHSSILK